jgi:hypothetical protein
MSIIERLGFVNELLRICPATRWEEELDPFSDKSI